MTIQLNISDNFTDLVTKFNNLYALVDSDLDFRSKISVTDAGGSGSLAYSSATGVITYTGPSNADIRGKISVTDAGGDGSLAYNSSTGVITYTGPSAAEVRAHISVTDAGGDGSLAYNSSTGVITYTGPSASDVRAHITGGDGITFSGGAVALTTPTRFRVYDSAGTTVLDLYGSGSL